MKELYAEGLVTHGYPSHGVGSVVDPEEPLTRKLPVRDLIDYTSRRPFPTPQIADPPRAKEAHAASLALAGRAH